jgi:hypothetical protein
MALIDGLGLRVLLGDPSMPLEKARERIGAILARELQISAGQLPFAADRRAVHEVGSG